MSTYKFIRNVDIGSLDAENDRLLMEAFVHKQDVQLVVDTSNPKCVLLGRTGSGKSAIIRYIQEKETCVVRIDPESMSLRHLSNSDIINYFKKLNINLDLFYKVLWKHVFIVELIKLHYESNIDKSKSLLDWIKDQLPDKNKKASIDYLEKWEDKFWQDTEYRIKELETSLENRFKGELGGGVSIKDLLELGARSEEEKTNSQTVKYEVLNKAQKVVNESQIEHIKNILEIMQTKIFSRTQKRYFVLIDDLDHSWVSSEIVYDLIKSLIDTIKDLSGIPQIKIVIALRSNIHKKVFKVNKSRGIQREKYDHLYIDIQWSKDELRELVNNRLRELMKGTYTNAAPKLEEVLPEANRKQVSGWDYLLERTLMRPRDVIDFFNKCIKQADGKTKITREMMKSAEDEYSHERIKALNDEWLENYGNLDTLYGFVKGVPSGFRVEDIAEKAGNYFVEVISSGKVSGLCQEFQLMYDRFGTDFDCERLLKPTLILLYEVGILGLKLSPDRKTEFIHESHSSFDVEDINAGTKFYVHPIFHKALRTGVTTF